MAPVATAWVREAGGGYVPVYEDAPARSWTPQTIEAAPQSALLLAPSVPDRRGYEYGIPKGGTATVLSMAEYGNRSEHLEQLFQAYQTCVWVSTCVDVIARTITAGGLHLVANTDTDEKLPETPQMQRLMRLLRFTNPRENMIQVTRSTITDLLVSGDAYIEIARLADEPIALYSLDSTTMQVDADEHGEVRRYIQTIDSVRDPVYFEPEEILHLSLDAPRGGLYGTSPTDKALTAVVVWLFTQACLKETMRKGNPPRVHVDHPASASKEQLDTWWSQYLVRNVGPKNIGTPITTKGGGHVAELSHDKIADYLETSAVARDQIIACFGVPPHKAGIVETGNLGGGTGESQDKTFKVNTTIPLAGLLLEALNYQIVQEGFGITTHHLEFHDVDYRDSKTIEDIRDQRLRNGSWTLNDYRGEIGKPPLDVGGDDPVIIDRGHIVYWRDIPRYTDAEIAQMEKGTALEAAGGEGPGTAGQQQTATPPGAQESHNEGPERDMRQLTEAWVRSYRGRRKRALKALPQGVEQ